jgi:hypothetical protein
MFDRISEWPLNLVVGAVGGFFVWWVSNFIGEPFVRFHKLRERTQKAILFHANAKAFDSEDLATVDIVTHTYLGKNQNPNLDAAKIELRHLSTELLALAKTRPIVCWFLSRGGYNVNKAGAALLGMSNTLNEYGGERARHSDNLARALRLPDRPYREMFGG